MWEESRRSVESFALEARVGRLGVVLLVEIWKLWAGILPPITMPSYKRVPK